MNKSINRLIAFLLVACFATFAGCKKEEVLTIPPEQVHFTQSTAEYYVTNNPNSSFKVGVGLTYPSLVARTINFTVSSPTGAVSGQQYTIASNSITIPAGKTVENIDIKGIFAGYPSGRKDTLVLTITGGDATIADFNKVYKLVLQKFCNVLLSDLLGTYTKSFDIQTGSPTYGPYLTSISNPVAVSATKATVRIANFWDVGTSLNVELDYSDPANFKATIPTQTLYIDPTYGRATIAQVGNGSFSSCDNNFTFSYTVTVAAGSFGNFTTKIGR